MQHYRLAPSYKTLILILYQVISLLAAQQASLQEKSLDELASATQDAGHSAHPPELAKGPPDCHTASFASPFMLLMSEDTVTLAQLPMIIYGNLTDIYQLDARELASFDEPEADVRRQDEDNLELEHEDLRERERAKHHAAAPELAGTDAREYEQMPQLTNVNTTGAGTTSLGKSEWQQIAVERQGREEVLLRARRQSVAGNRKDEPGEEAAASGSGAGNGEGSAGRQGRSARAEQRQSDGAAREHEPRATRARRRRSNSLSDYDDDSNSASGRGEKESHTSVASAAASAAAAAATTAVSDAQTPRSATAEESSGTQNVTSAQSSVGESEELQQPSLAAQQPQQKRAHEQQEANFESRGGNPALPEDGDKTGRLPGSPSPSFAAPTATSRGPLAPAAAHASSRVRFSDLDVHMALGYAFVADSAGRIHRFKLPTGNPRSSSPSQATAASAAAAAAAAAATTTKSGHTPRLSAVGRGPSGSGAFGENAAAGENDATANIIDPAGAIHGNSSAGSHERALADANRDAYDDAYSNRISNIRAMKKAAEGGGDGDRDDADTHEQFGNERQHPTISGGQSVLANPAGALVSGHRQQTSGGENQLPQLAAGAVESRVIWSRGKFVRGGAAHAESGASSLARGERQEQHPRRLANSGGALSAERARDGNHQLVGGANNGSEGGGASSGSSDDADADCSASANANANANANADDDDDTRARKTTSGGGRNRLLLDDATRQPRAHGDDQRGSERERSNCALKGAAGGEPRARPSLLRTEVAVDWLNNLLFVLDKCRLLVMDLEGNNELVLIDDFNANNRPTELKVDPVNGFLFWLQVGRFHNTIYKLDLSVLAIPSANSRLVRNAVKLRQNSDASDLVPLISHHYAHPIIMDLPRSTLIFFLDQSNSKLYLPLGPPPPPPAADSEAESSAHEGQILAYNIDGTDAGPLRTFEVHSAANSGNGSEDIQDLTLDSGAKLLYWLTNNGRDLFEEFRENATIQPAQHYLNGRSYSKLVYFDGLHSSQPRERRPRFNVRKIIDMVSSYISSNRPTRSGERTLDDEPSSLRVLHPDGDVGGFSRHAPYLILGVTCLIVTAFYLVYALIFQRMHRRAGEPAGGRHRGRAEMDAAAGGGSISGDSSLGSESQLGENSNRFVNSTSMKWAAGPSARNDLGASTFNRNVNTNSFTEYDLGSSNYATNAIDEHYREGEGPSRAHNLFDSEAGRLANLSSWPTDMHDLSNKQYVPIEFSQDEALNSIRRVSSEQLKIEKKEPLGEGHFGMVLQGSIRCTAHEKYNLLEKSHNQLTLVAKGPMSPDSLASPSRLRPFAPSSVSSGHGSSSSTSCEFATASATANTLTEPTSNNDYLTPKTHLNSTSSDYSVDMLAESSRGASYSGYQENASRSQHLVGAPGPETKLRVAIKKLKDNASRDEKRSFLQEAKLLANFDHPNIVRLIGICLDGDSTLIVMELMLGGDLIRYMQANTPYANEDGETNLTYDDLLKICLDIANGCCYLEDLDYIHRDLAARNCLVSSRKREERVVKLADFGLARDIYKEDYYRQNNDSAMPLKWMAPECLLHQKFSTKSDVWSFGIVMWEVMSYCQEKPHAGIEIGFLKSHLIGGAQLSRPKGCDENMYKLMTQCWHLEPSERPSFHECRAMLIELRNVGNV